MSDAKAPGQGIFNFNVCSQCMQPLSNSATRLARHAVPCGHVFCRECLDRVQTEQKSGNAFCRRPGCIRELGSASEFPVSWVPYRTERLRTELDVLFSDQGDAGDSPPIPPRVVEATPALCDQHKLPLHVAEVDTHRPVCSECLSAARDTLQVETFADADAALESSHAAVSAELATQKSKLAEPTFTAEEFCNRTAKWGAEETARIRAWEEREVKHVQTVASETVQLVQEVCASRIEMGASLIVQRAGMRASLEELDNVLINLPNDPAARLNKKRAVYTEWKRLCELLASGKIIIPWAHAVIHWAELSSLSATFDQKAVDNGGVVASSVFTAAKAVLDSACKSTPWMPDLPALPYLVRQICIFQSCARALSLLTFHYF